MGLCRKGLFVKAASVIALGCQSNSTKTPNLASLQPKSISHCGSCLSLNDVVLRVAFCAFRYYGSSDQAFMQLEMPSNGAVDILFSHT